MNLFHTLKPALVDFDLQSDVDLMHGSMSESPGADRAYLKLGSDTVALWRITAIEATELLSAVLGIGEPVMSKVKPWQLTWIRDGRLHLHNVPLGIDRGAYLIAALAPFEVLDRRAHLFGPAPVLRG